MVMVMGMAVTVVMAKAMAIPPPMVMAIITRNPRYTSLGEELLMMVRSVLSSSSCCVTHS